MLCRHPPPSSLVSSFAGCCSMVEGAQAVQTKRHPSYSQLLARRGHLYSSCHDPGTLSYGRNPANKPLVISRCPRRVSLLHSEGSSLSMYRYLTANTSTGS